MRRGVLLAAIFALGAGTGVAGGALVVNRRAKSFMERRHVEANMGIMKRVLARELDLSAAERVALDRAIQSNRGPYEALLREHERSVFPLRRAMFAQLREELPPRKRLELDRVVREFEQRRMRRYIPPITFEELASDTKKAPRGTTIDPGP